MTHLPPPVYKRLSGDALDSPFNLVLNNTSLVPQKHPETPRAKSPSSPWTTNALLRTIKTLQKVESVMKPPTPLFFPIFSGHFDTHFVFLCFQPQSHQPQRSGSPASKVRLTSLRDQAPSLNSQAHHHLPPEQAHSPPATRTGSLTTCHHVSLRMRLLYIQLSETDTLLFSLHTFFAYSCLRQTRFYSHSTPSLLNSCLRQTRFLFSLHNTSIHSLYLITQRHTHSFTVS
jgi:hypothetical protein